MRTSEKPRLNSAEFEGQPTHVRGQARAAWWASVLASLAALISLAVSAHSSAYFPLDLTVTQALQSRQSPALDALALGVNWLGYAPQIAILSGGICLGLWAFGRRWEGVIFLFGAALEGGAAALIKMLVQRPRPDVPGLHVYQQLGDFAFPSGHAGSYLLLFGLLAYFIYRQARPAWWRPLALLGLGGLILVIGPVRIYLGEHWLSDVVGGYLLGALSLLLLIRLYRWGQGKFETTPDRSA